MRKLVVRCLCALIASSYASTGQAADVPVTVEKTAQCKVAVLKATPGVVEPVLGTTSSDGWTHPFLEYRADEALTRTSAIRFDARQPSSGSGNRGYWLMAWKSGFGAPEYHVTEAVIKKWKARCHADVVLFFP